MGKPQILRLGKLQLQIMQVLWEKGAATVAEVQEKLPPDGALAYTTIATMLRKMEARGLVNHDVSGRSYIYRPVVPASEVTRTMTADLLDRLFEGSLADMISHLLTAREISLEELDQLETLIARRKKDKR